MGNHKLDEEKLLAIARAFKTKRQLDSLEDNLDNIGKTISKEQQEFLKIALKEGKEFKKLFLNELGGFADDFMSFLFF